MNLRDLKYLVSVAELRHFGKAAEACNVSQPALSMQLHKLEEELGVTLFERNNKQVLVTPVGEEIVAAARVTLREADEIREIAKAHREPLSGDFKLGAFPTLAPYYLPQIVPALRKQLPNIQWWLVEEKTQRLLELLKTGELDAAFIALPVGEKELEAVALFDDPFLLAVPKHHTLAKKKQVSMGDIRQETLLLLEEGHCLRTQALEVCSLSGVQESREFRATSLETLRQMVVAEVGITLMPAIARRAGEALAYIPFAGEEPSRRIALVYRKTSSRKACIHEMVKLLKKA